MAVVQPQNNSAQTRKVLKLCPGRTQPIPGAAQVPSSQATPVRHQLLGYSPAYGPHTNAILLNVGRCSAVR